MMKPTTGTTNTAGTAQRSGRALRRARERAGLTREQLAVRIEASSTQIQTLEAGARVKRSAVLERAWAALDEIDSEARAA